MIVIDQFRTRRFSQNYVAAFRQEVSTIIKHPKGWRSYGLSPHPDLRILLTSADDILSFTHVPGFSVCLGPTLILINEKNWRTGGLSQMPIHAYRLYVITHEMGHSFGFIHPTHSSVAQVSAEQGSIMQQMTRGPAFIYPLHMSSLPLPYPKEIQIQRIEKAAQPKW
jgi:hypothetical protein